MNVVVKKTVIGLFLALNLVSCSNDLSNFSTNDVFESRYKSEANKINKQRTMQEDRGVLGFLGMDSGFDYKNPTNFHTPDGQNSPSKTLANKYNYIDISYLGSRNVQYFPDLETYQQGISNNPDSGLDPNVFEIAYNTYLNKPFNNLGEDFDKIYIPIQDGHGVKSSASDKNYNLVPIASLQNAVRTIINSRSQDDLEISRKLIAERKNLLRKKQLEYYKEKNEYIKFFENNLSG